MPRAGTGIPAQDQLLPSGKPDKVRRGAGGGQAFGGGAMAEAIQFGAAAARAPHPRQP